MAAHRPPRGPANDKAPDAPGQGGARRRRSVDGAGSRGDGAPVDRDAPTEAQVLDLIAKEPGHGKREIARDLGLSASGKVVLRDMLRDLERDGRIQSANRRGYCLTDEAPPVGVVVFLEVDAQGDLMGVLAEREADRSGPRIRLDARGSARRGARPEPSVGIGDRVLCRLAKEPDGVYGARIIKKLEARGRRLLGVAHRERGGMRLKPISRDQKSEFLLPGIAADGIEPGDLVVFAIESERRQGLKTARVVEHVGRADAPHAPTIMAIHAHGLPDGFDPAEIAEAEAARPVSPKGREDLTGTPLVTIDPSDARDHDDAVWAAPDPDPSNPGGYTVIVAIADVAAYVRPGSALDRGAQMRGNSVYFPDRVVPMLPEALSTDLCSLKEGEPRACMAVAMTFAADGAKKRHRFMRAVMRSAARLTYEQAQAAIDGQPDDATGPLLDPVLRPLWAAWRCVDAARARRTPLAIEAPERRIVLDKAGRVAEITRRARLDAHKLIEEFMIQANVCAAETLEAKHRPVVFRVHDAPSPEKLDALGDFLREVKLSWSRGEPATPARFNRLLAQAARGENAEAVNEMVLRSQAQAVYAVENLGHFGLNLARYAHFTSPIRRYADLLVHRALIDAIGAGEDGLTEDLAKRLDTIAQAISTAERRAMAAEREASDRYLSAFLADKVGSVFAGRISGVTRAGAFVRLSETGADGLAPSSRLGVERFHHDAGAHALIGEESGGRFRLGMLVEVRLVEAAPITGGLLFDILTPPEPGERPRSRPHGRAYSRPHGRPQSSGGGRNAGKPKGRK